MRGGLKSAKAGGRHDRLGCGGDEGRYLVYVGEWLRGLSQKTALEPEARLLSGLHDATPTHVGEGGNWRTRRESNPKPSDP